MTVDVPAVSLSDSQLQVVMDAARAVPIEKRDVFLQRLAAMLALRGRGHFGDADVAVVVRLARNGLLQRCSAA